MEIRAVRTGEGLQLRDLTLRAYAVDADALGIAHDRTDQIPDALWQDRAAPAVDRITFIISAAANADAWGGLVVAHIELHQADQPPTVWLTSMWVEPALRGLGLGKRLTAAVVDWAREHNAAEVELEVLDANTAAIGLYAAAGFVVVGPASLGRARPELRMQTMALKLD